MNQLSPVGSHQTDPFTSQDEQQTAAIAGMVNQTARETEARIIALEKQVARHAAEAIANLSVASVEQGRRIEKLEAVLEVVLSALGYNARALSEMTIPLPE